MAFVKKNLCFQVKGDENTNFVSQKQKNYLEKIGRVYQNVFARSYPQKVCLTIKTQQVIRKWSGQNKNNL